MKKSYRGHFNSHQLKYIRTILMKLKMKDNIRIDSTYNSQSNLLWRWCPQTSITDNNQPLVHNKSGSSSKKGKYSYMKIIKTKHAWCSNVSTHGWTLGAYFAVFIFMNCFDILLKINCKSQTHKSIFKKVTFVYIYSWNSTFKMNKCMFYALMYSPWIKCHIHIVFIYYTYNHLAVLQLFWYQIKLNTSRW